MTARPAVAGPLANADRALTIAAGSWFAVTVLGQLIFAAYIAILYGGSAARGNLAAWTSGGARGIVHGDALGNVAFASHLLLAFVIVVGSGLQLVPVVRRRVPALHRWTGRAFMVAASLASLGGLYLMWVRGAAGDLTQHIGTSVNAVLILACVLLAWRAARAREFGAHRRWALRLFLCANGVWFFRIGLMLWLMIFRKPLGFDMKSFQGPFLSALTFAQYLLPLAVLELYLRSRAGGGTRQRVAMAAVLGFVTVATGMGVVGATLGLWLPHM